jgi:hypothetical protein
VSITQELLTFGVGVDTSSAEAGLASLGSTADGVAVGLEDRLSGASSELQNMGKASTGAGRGLTGLGAAISVVDPKLGAAVRQVGSLARGLTMLRTVSGPVAIGIGVITAALATYNAAQQISNERAERARERAERLTEALRAQAEATSDLQTETDLITGATDRYRLSAEEQIEQQKQLGAETRTAIYAQIQALRDERTEQEALSRSLFRNAQARVEAGQEARRLTREIASLEQQIEESNETQRANIRQIHSNAHALRTQGEATEDATTATNRRTVAVEAVTEAIAKQEAAELKAVGASEKAIATQQLLATLESEVASIRSTAADEQLSENERILGAYDQQIERLNEIQRITGESADIEAARAAVTSAREEAEFQMFLDHQAEKSRIEDEAHQDALDKIEEERQHRLAAQADISSALGSFGQLSSQIARTRAQEAEEAMQALKASGRLSEAQIKKREALEMAAAQRALNVSKSLGFAQIAIDTAVGIQKALANSAGNPVLAALGIASVVAGAATQAAAVGAQSLHQGGQLAPDEQSVRTVVLRDEAIDESGRVMSPEATRRMERGDTGRAQVVPIPQYQHFGVFFADVVESGGTPLHDLIYQGRDVGRAGY